MWATSWWWTTNRACALSPDSSGAGLVSGNDGVQRRGSSRTSAEVFSGPGAARYGHAGTDGLETLQRIREVRPATKVVILSCVRDTRKVAQAMRLGAQDYLSKPVQKEEMDDVLRFCLENTDPAGPGIGEAIEVSEGVFFFSATPQMRQLRAQAMQVAKFDFPVLLLGESGTGKEVLAQLIHKYSERAHRTFLKVNCAAMPSELLESELFGYEPGAFTGANKSKPGKFELCNKGTLLLDEIGEMSPALQAKLLQVLQDGQFSRLGGRSTVKVDVRVLAATNINMTQAIAQQDFPRRPLLPVEQLRSAHALVARAPRRDPHDAAALHDAPCGSLCVLPAGDFSSPGEGLRRISMARQHPRVGEFREALPGAGRRDSGHHGASAGHPKGAGIGNLGSHGSLSNPTSSR